MVAVRLVFADPPRRRDIAGSVAVMAVTTGSMRRRLVPAALMVAAACLGPAAVANASSFDVDGYSSCTATTVPAPQQDFDAVVSTCCVEHAGVPTSTRFGMGCVAPMDAGAIDERPTIVLPMRPPAPEESQDVQNALNDLADLPLPDPIP